MKFTLKNSLVIGILFSIIFFLLTFASPTIAAPPKTVTELIRVSPVILNIELSPGKIYTYRLSVENLQEVALPVDASVETFYSTSDEDPSSTNSLVGWTHLDKTQLLLNPHDRQSIKLTVSLPKKIPVGGYYAMVFLTPHLPTNETYGSFIAGRVGIILLASIGVPSPFSAKAVIDSFTPSQFIFETSPLSFDFKVRNNSLTHFTAKPFITLYSFGSPAYKFVADEKIVFPGKSRSWETEINYTRSWMPIHVARLQVSTGNGNTISQQTLFLYLPLKKLLLVIFGGILAIYIIVKRKNVVRALGILIKNK